MIESVGHAALQLVGLGIVLGAVEWAYPNRAEQGRLRPQFATDLAFYFGQHIIWLGVELAGLVAVLAFGQSAGNADPLRFVSRPRPDGAPRWLANLPQLAHDRLLAAGLHSIHRAEACTVEEPSRFFSFRRDGVTGRMAAAIWRL